MNTSGSILTCHECHLDGGPFSPEEAAVHVATHNRLHHRGAPTAAAVAATLQIQGSAAA